MEGFTGASVTHTGRSQATDASHLGLLFREKRSQGLTVDLGVWYLEPCETEEKREGRAGFLSPRLSSGGVCPGARLPSMARRLGGCAHPGWELTFQRPLCKSQRRSKRGGQRALSADCGSEGNGNRSLRKDESPLPDYVLILLSHASKTASMSRVLLKELSQY